MAPKSYTASNFYKMSTFFVNTFVILCWFPSLIMKTCRTYKILRSNAIFSGQLTLKIWESVNTRSPIIYISWSIANMCQMVCWLIRRGHNFCFQKSRMPLCRIAILCPIAGYCITEVIKTESDTMTKDVAIVFSNPQNNLVRLDIHSQFFEQSLVVPIHYEPLVCI